MTPDTDTLRRLAATITPGPWEVFQGDYKDGHLCIGVSAQADICLMSNAYAWRWAETKANATATALVPDLLAEVIALRERSSQKLGSYQYIGADGKPAMASVEQERDMLRERLAALERDIREASDPDFLFGAMDNVNVTGVPLYEFVRAASRAIRRATNVGAPTLRDQPVSPITQNSSPAATGMSLNATDIGEDR